jgi:phytoene synthase
VVASATADGGVIEVEMSASEYCRRLTRRSGTSFYYAFRLLPRPQRDAIYTVYSLCREIDDVVDRPEAGTEQRAELRRWRAELDQGYDGHPSHPITRNLQTVLQSFPIPRQYFHQLIDGVEMDLDRNRYRTFRELHDYCYRVAAVVGLMCLEIFHCRTSAAARRYAVNLGLAFQLTNILRDIGVDADRNRIYLPAEDLARFGYSETDLLERRYSAAFVELMRFQCGRARNYFRACRDSIRREDRPNLVAAEIMRHTYEKVLRRIEACGYDIFKNRVRLPGRQKIWIAGRTWLVSRVLS